MPRGMECVSYAMQLYKRYGGDFVDLESAEREYIRVPVGGNTSNCLEYKHHFIFVKNGLVYDVMHNNMEIPIREYVSMLESVMPEGIAAVSHESTKTFGLKVKKHRKR